MLHPRDIATAIVRLRGASLMTFDGLSDVDLDVEALPGWTVADVFRHLADSDRGSVLGVTLLEFLPGKDLFAYERKNDENLARLRGVDRNTLRGELERWGRRLARVVRMTPAPLGRVVIPTAFGRVPLAWMACLRPYDEWVHQWDVAMALGRDEPLLDAATADLLAEFQLRALPAGGLKDTPRRPGVTRIAVADGPTWQFDLANHRFGAHVAGAPTVTIRLDVPTFCLIAGDRRPWRELEAAGRVVIEGDDRSAAELVLDACRVV
jgi:uncharacterized protein (TIGR03083 family)